MKIVSYKCDYCGKEIQDEVEAIQIGSMEGEAFIPDMGAIRHYHKKCLDETMGAKKKPATQKKTLDMDKIRSLP